MGGDAVLGLWAGAFEVDGTLDAPVRLAQIGPALFRLDSTLRYVGERTGLEGRVEPATIAALRTLTPAQLPSTDLASVPSPLLWLVSRYGPHTPAALVHDRLIGRAPGDLPGLTDEACDRCFRFLLQALGVAWLRRWMMWAAVALRTRFEAGGLKRASVVLWLVLSLVGQVAFLVGLVHGSPGVVLVAAVAPLPASLLWWRQAGAALIGASTALWVLPPTLLGAVGYGVYWVLERLGMALHRKATGRQPGTRGIDYKHF